MPPTCTCDPSARMSDAKESARPPSTPSCLAHPHETTRPWNDHEDPFARRVPSKVHDCHGRLVDDLRYVSGCGLFD